MAGSIGGNFHVPGQKTVQTGRQTGSVPGKQEIATQADQVSIGGHALAPAPEKQTLHLPADAPLHLPTDPPLSLPGDPIRQEQQPVDRAPGCLLMQGVSRIGGYVAPADGSGVTGLNSLSSVVASGTFQGLKGTYGQRNPFSF